MVKGMHGINRLKTTGLLDHVCKKLAYASYALLKLRAFSPISTLKTVYYALDHPHLSYGLACWSNATKTSLKQTIILRNKIVRLMTYSDQRTHQAYANPSKFWLWI